MSPHSPSKEAPCFNQTEEEAPDTLDATKPKSSSQSPTPEEQPAESPRKPFARVKLTQKPTTLTASDPKSSDGMPVVGEWSSEPNPMPVDDPDSPVYDESQQGTDSPVAPSSPSQPTSFSKCPFYEQISNWVEVRDFVHDKLCSQDNAEVKSRPFSAYRKWIFENIQDPFFQKERYRRLLDNLHIRNRGSLPFPATLCFKPFTDAQFAEKPLIHDMRPWQLISKYKFPATFLVHLAVRSMCSFSPPTPAPFEGIVFLVYLGKLYAPTAAEADATASTNSMGGSRYRSRRAIPSFRRNSECVQALSDAVQIVMNAWNAVARALTFASIGTLIAPYIIFDSEKALYRVLSDDEGFAPHEAGTSLEVQNHVTDIAESFPSALEPGDHAAHLHFRQMAALVIDDLSNYLLRNEIFDKGISELDNVYMEKSSLTPFTVRFDECIELLQKAREAINAPPFEKPRPSSHATNSRANARRVSYRDSSGEFLDGSDIQPEAGDTVREDPVRRKRRAIVHRQEDDGEDQVTDRRTVRNGYSTERVLHIPRSAGESGFVGGRRAASRPPSYSFRNRQSGGRRRKYVSMSREQTDQTGRPERSRRRVRRRHYGGTAPGPGPSSAVIVIDEDSDDNGEGNHALLSRQNVDVGHAHGGRYHGRGDSYLGAPFNVPIPIRGADPRREDVRMNRYLGRVGPRPGERIENGKSSCPGCAPENGRRQGRLLHDEQLVHAQLGELPKMTVPPRTVMKFLGALWNEAREMRELRRQPTNLWPAEVVRDVSNMQPALLMASEASHHDLYTAESTLRPDRVGMFTSRAIVKGELICHVHGSIVYECAPADNGNGGIIGGASNAPDTIWVTNGEGSLAVDVARFNEMAFALPPVRFRWPMDDGRILLRAFVVPSHYAMASHIANAHSGVGHGGAINALVTSTSKAEGLLEKRHMCMFDLISIVAMRDIKSDEEICIDYITGIDSYTCACRSSN